MKMRLLAIIAALTVSTLLLATPALAQVPQPPHQFWGAVTVDNSTALDGTVVSVELEDVAITWSTTTSDGKYGYSPLFKIPSDDPATAEKDGGVNGDLIVFRVGGAVAEATFESGGLTELDLSITGPLPPPLTAEAGGPYSGTRGASIALSGSASGGTLPYTFDWDLDNDGVYDDATGNTTSHSWGTAGTYSIGLEVTDNVSAIATDTANVTVTVPAPSGLVGGGGGGGGGGAPTYYAETNLFGTETRFRIDSDGEILKTIEATSDDGMLTMTIPKGTIALDKDGKRLKNLQTAVDESPPSPPEDANIVGLAYDFGPAGVTFDPPITLTWRYDPDAIPEGVSEEGLVIAVWDEDAGEWVELEGCIVDPENNIITASVSHFSKYALIARRAPPPVAPPPPPPPPVEEVVPPPPPEEEEVAPVLPPEEEEEVPEVPAEAPINWTLIGAIIAVVVVAVVLLIYFLWVRRRLR